MLGIDPRAARTTWTVVATLILLWIIYQVRQTIFLFVVALLFAYLLWPLVDYLDKRLPGRSRTPALVIVYSLLIAALIILGIEVGSRVVHEANTLAVKIPDFLAALRKPATSGALSKSSPGRNLAAWAGSLAANYAKNIATLLPKAGLKVLSFAKDLIFFILVPVLAFFFLKEGRAMRQPVLSLLGSGHPARQELLESLARDLDVLLGRYMRALVTLAAIAFCAYGLFLALMKVHYAILLAAVAGPLEFIPVVGPFVAFVIIMLAAALTAPHRLIWVFLFMVIFRLFEDYFISPRIMSKQVKLHPLLVILGVLAGGEIAGVAGAFLSVPVMATLRVVYRHLMRRQIQIPDSSSIFKP
ncbi:MAG: AI-2E family transporter [Terriglobia bacterium]